MVLVLVASACSGGSDSAELQALRERVESLEAEMSAVAPAPTIATVAAPTTLAALTPAEVFAAVSPSVVFIEVPSGTGSGVLLSSGYVVTNAHVVGHFPTVRIFTSLGEVAEVPVHARDWFSDLALIGPMPFDEMGGKIPAVDFGSSATVAIGDNVYLIGYPGEVESQPEPTMTSGTLSRRRLARCLGLTFLQTDAMIAGGQSGGALVDATGQLIGLSGLTFAETYFGLALTAENISAVLADLDEGSGSLSTPEGHGALRQSARVSRADSAGYLVTVTEEQPLLSVTTDSPDDADVWLSIDRWDGRTPWWHWPQDEVDYIWGDPYALDEEEPGLFFLADAFDDGTTESLEVSLVPGVYVVSVGHFSYTTTEVSVEASSSLTLLEDLEPPGRRLTPGKSITGALNHIQDLDSYRIDLQKGDTIRIQMVAIADSVMSLYRDDLLVASSDDAGIGLYGDGAEIIFEAGATGRYDLEVMVLDWVPAAYVLTLDLADTNSPTC